MVGQRAKRAPGAASTHTTVSRLKPLLVDYFGRTETDTAFRCARLAGTIPSGQSGHGGCRSAEITAQQAVLVTLALASGAPPKAAAAAAARIGRRFWLLRHDQSRPGESALSTPYTGPPVSVLDAMIAEIERFDEDRPPSSWAVGSGGCCQIAPERALFGTSLEDVVDPAVDSDRIVRTCTIPARLIADIGELLRQDRVEAD